MKIIGKIAYKIIFLYINGIISQITQRSSNFKLKNVSMKNFTLTGMLFTILMLIFGIQGLNGQGNSFDEIQTLMELTSGNGNLPAAIDDAGANRGASFNGEHVFIASRTNGLHVYYWDVNDPTAAPQELDMTGVSGGVFPINEVTTVGDHIFASNMDFSGGTFKLYHWANINAAPTLLIEYAAIPARLGDAFTVLGDPEVFASIVVTGHGSNNVYVWSLNEGALETADPEVFTMDALDNVNFSRATVTLGGDDGYNLLSGPFGVSVLDEEANIELTIPQSFFPGWSMYAQPFLYEGNRYLSYIHVRIGEVVENIMYVLDIGTGDNLLEAMTALSSGTFADHVVHEFNLGTVSNGNASVSNDVVIDPFGNLWLMGFAAGNGFVVQKLGDAFMYTLPFVENFEGEGDETSETWFPEGWMNVDADGDDDTWLWGSRINDDEVNETFMRSYSYDVDEDGNDFALTPDNWLITPAILLPSLDLNESIKVLFEVSPSASTPAYRKERYEILISTTDTETNSFTMLWEETFRETDERWVWQPKDIDISAYEGSKVYLAIRHHGTTFLDAMALKNFSVILETPVETLADLILNVRMAVWADDGKFAPENDFVDVAGSFNNWGDDPLQLTALDDEFLTYNITVPDLVIGDEYEFKFRINGSWDDATAEFPFGGSARKVTIQETDNEYTFWYNDDIPTSIDQISQNQFRVFPNPATAYVTIQSEDQINSLVVTDITGRIIQELPVNDFETTLDVSSFDSGIYLIAIHTENEISFSKVQVK
jgi:hypothetical protein